MKDVCERDKRVNQKNHDRVNNDSSFNVGLHLLQLTRILLEQCRKHGPCYIPAYTQLQRHTPTHRAKVSNTINSVPMSNSSHTGNWTKSVPHHHVTFSIIFISQQDFDIVHCFDVSVDYWNINISSVRHGNMLQDPVQDCIKVDPTFFKMSVRSSLRMWC